MHPGVILGATVSAGALVLAGAYAYTTNLLTDASPSTPTSSTTGTPFLVATCVTQATLIRVPEPLCLAATQVAARNGTDPNTAAVAWRYVPSSMTSPVNVPPVGVEVDAGSFIADPFVARYTEDALDIYGRPPVTSTDPNRIFTSRGVL